MIFKWRDLGLWSNLRFVVTGVRLFIAMSSAASIPPRSANRATSGGRIGPAFSGEMEFAHVTYDIGAKPVLRDISFTVKPGEIACLLGPSGCGKTSVLRLAAGIVSPHAGEILIDQAEVAGPNRFVQPEKRNVGLMFQDYALFPHMTVLENVAYGLYALSKVQARDAARQVLQRVALADKEDRYPHQLSGGEQQRVALARAIAPRPQLIMMDEPFSGLDQRLRDDLRGETLQLLREARSSAIFVTHDPVEAMAIADRIILMRDGRIVQQGTPHQLHDAPLDAGVVRFFSEVNEFTGRVENLSLVTPVGRLAAKDFADGTAVQVLVRPSAIRHKAQGSLQGLVLETRYLGNLSRARVLFASGTEPVTVYVDESDNLEPGDTAQFEIDPRGVFLFKSP
jgi:iron(III) transport system ATP-binding protein